FSGIAYVQGKADILDEPIVSEVRNDMPAQEAGILSGDRITAIDGSTINTWKELTNVIHKIPNTPISLTILRDESKFELSLTTSYMILPNSGRIDTLGAIGIVPQIIYSDILWSEALNAGVLATFNTVGMIVMSLHMLFTGVASVADLGGPIMIAQLAGQTANEGWIPLLSFMALISVNLAFLNIFPIPGLDGGHVFILLIESVIRRPLTLRARMVIQQIGMTFLLILMVTVVFNDITRLFN
ncbi:MAG: RIP metalloprotease RseP, partial [Candidatus Neomarinimicrobiota bacterium]|nr:RIP metalloprotease RseP [Candidatus Neomarinimicrobiota bacterium]